MTPDMLCAKGNNIDSCYGDSGGPLMCQLPDDYRFTLCGIVSFGNSNCLNNSFGVYTKTFNFINTIKVIATS